MYIHIYIYIIIYIYQKYPRALGHTPHLVPEDIHQRSQLGPRAALQLAPRLTPGWIRRAGQLLGRAGDDWGFKEAMLMNSGWIYYIYIYMYIYVYIYISNVYIYYLYICIYVCIYIYMYVFIHTSVYIHIGKGVICTYIPISPYDPVM